VNLPWTSKTFPRISRGRVTGVNRTAAEIREKTADPEVALSRYRWQIDPVTFREYTDDPTELIAIRDGLTARLRTAEDHARRARLLGLRAVVHRVLGDLDDALRDAKLALTHAQTTRVPRRIALAQTRLARVHQWRGEYEEADRLYTLALDADIPRRLRALIHHHAAVCCLEQDRLLEALNHTEASLANRGSDQGLFEAAERVFDTIIQAVSGTGFGPYPRSRNEILGTVPPPQPYYHEMFRRYGFETPDGDPLVPATYRDVYPFTEGYAWVLPENGEYWELIDESGTVVIGTDAGYHHVSPFSQGVAWVRADRSTGWFGINAADQVVIPPGHYVDVRPFHGGLAAVRPGQGGWGALDLRGQVVVPFEYDAICTARADGSYITGFTEEGLAVVERDGLRGVVDRTGQEVLPLIYREVQLHPLAFLVLVEPEDPDYSDPFVHTVDLNDGWGALDRSGETIVPPIHLNRAAVLEELDKLLAEAHPVL